MTRLRGRLNTVDPRNLIQIILAEGIIRNHNGLVRIQKYSLR